jgi:sulfite exporter TauE/SafE
MAATILQGLTLGLSTGLFCLAYCAPVFVPFMMAEQRDLRRILRTIGELALGRLVAYLAFGAAVGYLGAQLQGPVVQKAIAVAMIALSALLLLYVATRGWPHLGLCRQVNERYLRFPILFGLLTGLNICPPFLLAISAALDAGSILLGVLLFAGFFLGTSVYLAVLLPVGYLGRWPALRTISWMTALLSGLYFLVQGVVSLST